MVFRMVSAVIRDREAPVSTLPFLPGELPEPTPEQAAQPPGRGTPRLRVPRRDQVAAVIRFLGYGKGSRVLSVSDPAADAERL